MKDLRMIKEGLAAPADFLTTVTSNTFRPQYYFDQKKSVLSAVEVHKKYSQNPEQYAEYVKNIYPLMLDSHKILSAVEFFDKQLDVDSWNIPEMLSKIRPDHVPDFWLTILDFHKELGLKKTSLGSKGKKLVKEYLTHVGETRGLKTLALWFIKNKTKWNQVIYRAHVKADGDLECMIGGILFGRKKLLAEIKDKKVKSFLGDLAYIAKRKKRLTLQDVEDSNLPFRTLEGYASQAGIDTTTLKFYKATFDKMTNYEVLRRTGAMLRNGFLDKHHDEWVSRMKKAAETIDPVEIGSVMLQHPELKEDLKVPLKIAIERIALKFPKKSFVICDASRSMKMMKTNARPRVLWELVGLVAASQNVPVLFAREISEEVTVDGIHGVLRQFGTNEAYNPTCLSRAIEEAKELKPKMIFIISDCQTNLPYRGHEKLIAEKMKEVTFITLNPTVNPLEPEAATHLGIKNEIALPLSNFGFLSKVLGIITG